MIEEVWQDRITYAPPPRRFEAGTPPIVQAIGLAAAVEYVQNLGQELIHTHERDIACYADACLRDLDFIQFLDSHTPCGTIIAFNMIGTHPHDVAAVLDRTGIAIRAGTHCAQPLLQHFGLTATCRVSFGLYNTFEEVDRLVDNLKKAKSFFI